MNFIENKVDELIYMTAPVIKASHAFTTRFGGVSEGIYADLNLGENRGDDTRAVRENYRRIGVAAGIDTGRMVFTRQVHGAQVKTVTSAHIHRLFSGVPYEADGIVTNERKLCLVCFTADCVPVLLCDSVHGVIAAVHCGWRSSVADILGAAVGKMCELGAEAADICAAVGPSIGRCCFEVGGEVIEAAEKYLGGAVEGLYAPEAGVEGKFFLDLKGANARRLLQLGLKGENIAVSEECTMCESHKYWSHRKTKGLRGSQAALIMLDGKD